MGELKRHIRDHGWAARVPRSLQENVLKVTATAEELGGRLGRSPSPRELATETGMDVESVLEAMLAASAFESTSLDGHVDDGDGRVEPRVAVLGVDEHGYEQVERAVTLWPMVAALPDDERAVIALRFLGDLTQSEIARRIGIKKPHRRLAHRRAALCLGLRLNRTHTRNQEQQRKSDRSSHGSRYAIHASEVPEY